VSSDRAEALSQGIAYLRQAAELSVTRLEPEPALEALAAAQLLDERLARGVDHTVVALQGGTGSGKSSLFNAVSEMSFSEVGPVRPTTSKATACVWGPGAEELLNWLGVERDSWIKRDSVLETHIGELRGLILVDLPDYDSAVEANHLIADRVLPLADVVIWVTDPQKYADPALHERFVEAAKTHQGRLNMVVLNQVDTLTEAEAARVEESLVGLLVADGLTDPVVALTSAKTGAGVDAVRQALMDQTAHGTTGMRRAASDLEAAARALAQGCAVPADGSTKPAEQTWLGRATRAVADLWTAVAMGAEGVVKPQAPDLTIVRQGLALWLAEAAAVLPHTWASTVAYALATPANTRTRLEEALAEVPLPPEAGLWARLFSSAKAEARRRDELASNVRAAIEPVLGRTLAEPTCHVLADFEQLATLINKTIAISTEALAPLPASQVAPQTAAQPA
jgi:GTP-binding protein EngB required for normal cell division